MSKFPKTDLHILGFIFLLTSTFAIELDNLRDETQFEETNYAAFKHFGDKTIVKGLEQKPVALSLALNANLENTFEHNLIAPNSEDYQNLLSIQTHQGLRYTSTPVEAYKVKEEVYEPQPIPQIVSTPGRAPLILGSGSLGVVNLGHGKYALGSGSLGYSQPIVPQPPNKIAEVSGGLHVVPPPSLGSSEAFNAAFNNFNFKPMSHFFDHN